MNPILRKHKIALKATMRDPYSILTTVSVLALGLCLMGTATSAQEASPPQTSGPKTSGPKTSGPSKEPTNEVSAVTVTAEKPAVVNKIDRSTYDVSKDVQAQTGTAADVLNNVPSVNVDPSGNVSLRGNSNVQVYLNGKPSAMLQGDNRAATLQSMSADDIQNVEVINNPSAAFRSEGAGGIINIVTKTNRALGASGAIIANLGSEGRYNAAISGSNNLGKLTLNGGLNLRHDGRKSWSDSDRIQTNSDGSQLLTTQHTVARGFRDSRSARAGVEYKFTDKDTVNLDLSFADRDTDGHGSDHTAVRTGTGTGLSDILRQGRQKNPQTDKSAKLSYEHRGKVDGETLKLTLNTSESDGKRRTDYTNSYLNTNQPQSRDVVRRDSDTQLNGFSGDYTRPLDGGRILALGFDFEDSDNSYYNYAANFDPTTGAEQVNINRTNLFKIRQTLQSGYVTYQQPIGKFETMFGLRFEDLNSDMNQVTSNIKASSDFQTWSPSLHVRYALNDKSKLKFSYSHRTQRPAASDLNPFVTYVDAHNMSAGNPYLRPQETQSYEVGYEYTSQPLTYSANLFYRDNSHTITTTTSIINNDVLLTSKINLGNSQSYGMDINFNGKLTPALSYNLNGTIFHTDMDAPSGSLRTKLSTTSSNGKASLEYKITSNDRLQISGFMTGKVLTAQGSRSGISMVNLAYRHQFDPRLSLVITAMDLFNGTKVTSKTDTSFIQDRTVSENLGQVVFIGLSYRLGGPGGNHDRGHMGGFGPREGRGGPPPMMF